jgi:hypothetical protein
MTKLTVLSFAIVLAGAGVARAGGKDGSVGVGVEAEISGLAGVSANYDAGSFHVGGFLGYQRPGGGGNNTTFIVGGRFFFHLHKTAMSDFSLGGNLGVASIPNGDTLPGFGGGAINCGNMGMPPTHCTAVYFEPAFQIRLFVAANVALSFTGGVVLGVADANEIGVGGQVTALAGVHYYFF